MEHDELQCGGEVKLAVSTQIKEQKVNTSVITHTDALCGACTTALAPGVAD